MEDKYGFMYNGIFDIVEHDDIETVAHRSDFITQLQSPEALEYINTVRVWIGSLYSRTRLIEALNVFASQSINLTEVLLHQYDCQCYDIDNVIDYLKVFKNVPTVSVITNAYHYIEIYPLKNFFNDHIYSVAIKHFSINAYFHVALDMIDAIQSNDMIETIDLAVRYVDTIDPNMPLKLTNKLRKLTFAFGHNNTQCFYAFFENMIVSNPSVTKLDISDSPITLDTIKVITDNIQNLEILNIKYVNEGMFELLSEALMTSNVVELHIIFDHLKFTAIANLLALNKSLKIIQISFSRTILVDNLIAIVRSLADNTSIKKFHCANVSAFNGDTTESTESITQTFTEILTNNHTLLDFCISIELPNYKAIRLKNITDRNKIEHDQLRFAKTKALTNS